MVAATPCDVRGRLCKESGPEPICCSPEPDQSCVLSPRTGASGRGIRGHSERSVWRRMLRREEREVRRVIQNGKSGWRFVISIRTEMVRRATSLALLQCLLFQLSFAWFGFCFIYEDCDE